MKGFYSTSSVFGASWASMFLGSTRFRMMATMNTTATQFSANTVCTILGKSYWYDRVSVELRLKWHDVRERYDWCSAECGEIHHTHAHCYYISNHKSEQNWELLPVFGKKSQRTLDGTSHKYRSDYRIIAVCRSQITKHWHKCKTYSHYYRKSWTDLPDWEHLDKWADSGNYHGALDKLCALLCIQTAGSGNYDDRCDTCMTFCRIFLIYLV